ncbi:hypothetical protein Efla_005543 [Eimeria flavescens]
MERRGQQSLLRRCQAATRPAGSSPAKRLKLLSKKPTVNVIYPLLTSKWTKDSTADSMNGKPVAGCPEGSSVESSKRSDVFGWSEASQQLDYSRQGSLDLATEGLEPKGLAAQRFPGAADGAGSQLETLAYSPAQADPARSLSRGGFTEQTEKQKEGGACSRSGSLALADTSSSSSVPQYYPQVLEADTRDVTGQLAAATQQAVRLHPSVTASRGALEQEEELQNAVFDKFMAGEQYGLAAAFLVDANAGDEPPEIQECPYCHRTFASKSFEKHVNVCVKVFFTRRKQYDMSRKRLASVIEEAGVTAHSTLQRTRGGTARTKELERPREKKWQRESAQFRAAMRMARACDPREIAEAEAIFAKCSDMGVNRQCQHCGRTFGRDEALEKHEGVCQRMFKNGRGLRKGGGLCAAQGAACRLQEQLTLKAREQKARESALHRRNSRRATLDRQRQNSSQLPAVLQGRLPAAGTQRAYTWKTPKPQGQAALLGMSRPPI